MRQVKYENLELLVEFLYKAVPDFEFRDEVVVQQDVPTVKILLQVMLILKIITNKVLCQDLT